MNRFALALSLGVALSATAARRGPSEARMRGSIPPAETCGACHVEAFAAWSGSAHRHASLDNPWYLASFEGIRADVGFRASEHCAGCHDPVLLAEGAIRGPVSRDHSRGDEGVTCAVCHGMQRSGYRGNADHDVRLTWVDPDADVEGHRAAMRTEPVRTGTVCRGCHRGTLGPGTGNAFVVRGFDDWGAWEASGWAAEPSLRFEAAKSKGCVDCHGPHGVVGGRTAISAQTGRLGVAVALLKQAVEVRIPAVWVEGQRVPHDTPIEAGTPVVVDVTVRNIGAGHRFPGGLADTQDVELRVHIGHALTAAGAHFRSLPLTVNGEPIRDHRPERVAFAAFDQTIPPGEVSLVRVGFDAPGGRLDVRAEVVHRSHRAELAEAACAVSGPTTLDGCAPLPESVIAEGRLTRMDADGAYALGLGWARGVQEDLQHGLYAIEGYEGARFDALRGRLLGRQGRLDEALDVLTRVPEGAARARLTGDAHAAVWSWSAAADAYGDWAERVPRDVAAWRSLARARGSAGDAGGALEAAESGLELDPYDVSLLRSRFLALDSMGSKGVRGARDAWLAARPPDGVSKLLARCDREIEECADRAAVRTLRAEPR